MKTPTFAKILSPRSRSDATPRDIPCLAFSYPNGPGVTFRSNELRRDLIAFGRDPGATEFHLQVSSRRQPLRQLMESIEGNDVFKYSIEAMRERSETQSLPSTTTAFIDQQIKKVLASPEATAPVKDVNAKKTQWK